MDVKTSKLIGSTIAAGAALAIFFTACGGSNVSDKPVARDSGSSATTSTTQVASASIPASSPSSAGTGMAGAPSPTAAPASAPPAGTSLVGKVVDTMNSGGYTYMLISSGGKETWAAVNQTKVKKGDMVSVENGLMMEGFQSGTLHRKFDHILFGSLAASSGEANAAGGQMAEPLPAGATADASGKMPPGHPDASDPKFAEMMAARHAAAAQGPADVGDVKTSKAEGPNAHTVAELFANRTSLKDKDVVVRGKVVKFLPEIMGHNWLHVRDGSGSSDKKDNDLTVTTSDTAAVGDVVVVRGPVHLDRDFGAGYSYTVIIEDAKISK